MGYNRYQKKIMGMWLVQELCPQKDFADIVREAEQSTFDGTINANAADFLAPQSMKAAFDNALKAPSLSEADYFAALIVLLPKAMMKQYPNWRIIFTKSMRCLCQRRK